MRNSVFLLFLFLASYCLGQNARLDSIKQLERQSSGAEKAKHQADLTWFLARYNVDSSLHYGKKAIAYYEEVNDTLLSDVYNCLGYAHARNGLSEKAVEYYLKSLEITEKINYSRGTRAVLSHLSILYKKITNQF